MPKPTKTEIQEHKRFLRRQKVYESKYRKKFYSWLRSVSRSAANSYKKGLNTYDINQDRLDRIYTNLYTEITINEASLQWGAFESKPIKQKDIINTLAGALYQGVDEPIGLWQSLLKEFITVRIAGRITNVEQTTRKRIAVLIERGIAEGLSADEIAKIIMSDTDFNKNRALAIARTETITSANQGKYIAAVTSPFVKIKKWLPINGERTRLSHLDFYDRPFVEMEQDFFVANAQGVLEAASYPCDNRLSASNTVNCRCIIVFKNKLDSRGLPIKRGY